VQRRAAVADRTEVRILGFWLACGVAVVVGQLWVAPPLGVAALVLAAGAGGIAAARASSALGAGGGRPRPELAARGHAWLCVAVWAAMLGRGALAVANDDPAQWPGPPAPAAGLRELEIEEASHPGPRCRALARSGGVAVWLDAPPEACPLASGERIRVRADRIRLRTTVELPGDPSPLDHARARGAVAVAAVDRVWRADAAPSGGDPGRARPPWTPAAAYWAWVAEQRQTAWSVTRGDPDTSFVVAAGLGVRSTLSSAHSDALRRAGLGHLIAVSGLSVGLAAWAILALVLRVGARVGGSTLGVVLSWVPLVAYVLLTGASPPAVRAGVMAVGVGLGGLVGRPHHGPTLLVVTSVLMLVARPAWAHDPGFQLSVAAMATLVRAPAGEGIVRQTWRVTWVVLPFSLWHFGHAGAWGVVANLVAVPLFTLWVLPLGLLGWWLVPWLGAPALWPAALGARPILAVAEVVARWPSPPAWALGVVAGVAFVVGLVVRRRGPQGQLHPWWAWLPPLPVAAAVVLVVAWPRAGGAPAVQWWAAGSPRAPAIVTVTRDGHEAVACVHAASLSPARFRGLLDALGLAAAGMAPRAPAEAAEGPHEQALRRALEGEGRWVEAPTGCPAPPPTAAVTQALEACRRRAGSRHGMAAMGPEGLLCFVDGRWLLDSPSGSSVAGDRPHREPHREPAPEVP
jgi:ComEC/Rec2-related protein